MINFNNIKRTVYKNGKSYTLLLVEELCDTIKLTIEQKDEQIAHLLKENRELKEETYKDYIIRKWQQANEELRQENYNGFPISNEEKKAIENWKRQHNTLIHNNESSGAIGGRYDYVFTPTSIGDVGICRCSSYEKRILQQVFKEAQEEKDFIFSQRFKELKEKNDVEFVFRHL